MDHPLDVECGFEGANPQSTERVTREAPDRFRVEPFNEPGSTIPYYFRCNVRVRNRTEKERPVELLVEWPVLAERPDYYYGSYYYGDVGAWEWTYAYVEGTTAKLRITVPPGTTYVGYFPRYPFSRWEEYVASLPDSGLIETWIEGRSGEGRPIRVVKLTDPAIPDGEKRSVFANARIHPYETSCSYVAEAMIDHLLSDDPDARQLLEGNVVYLLPMVNPDGVVAGLNKLTRPDGVDVRSPLGEGDDVALVDAVDSEEPEVRTLIDFVERVRPDIWFDVHSWPHREDDGLSHVTDDWVADAVFDVIPDGTFQEYVWKTAYFSEGETPAHNIWNWVAKREISHGAAVSVSWYRRSEADVRAIGRALLEAMAHAATFAE